MIKRQNAILQKLQKMYGEVVELPKEWKERLNDIRRKSRSDSDVGRYTSAHRETANAHWYWFGAYMGVRKAKKVYKECCWDRVSVMMVVISLAVAVYFGEGIKAVVLVNLLVIVLVVHIIYVIVRWYAKGWREARGYF